MPKPNLLLCLFFDFVGCATYLIPGLGEISDVFWAPLSAFIFYSMFKKKLGIYGAVISYSEEVLPWTDFIPTFTLAWFIRNYSKRHSNNNIRFAEPMYKSPKPEIIDLDKIFKDKNPGLYKMIPGFIIRYLKRIIHQDKMNLIVEKNEGIEGVDFANSVLNEIDVKVSCSGYENIPETGPVIIVSNHPLAGLDALALMSFVGKKRKDIRFLVNDVLTRLPNFGEVFVPVNKFGTNAKSNLLRIEEIYASDAAVMLFPAGMCSRILNRKIQDKEWQKSFVTKAQKYNTPILPALVKGKNSNWFYIISRFRTLLGIKANFEMFYLPDEMFKQKGKTIELIFGPQIMPEVLTNKKNIKELAQQIKAFVYTLDVRHGLSFKEFLMVIDKKKQKPK